MSANSGVERDSFQSFLANAFAVQESGLDSMSVAHLIDLQHFVGREDFDLGEAMNMMAGHALHVAGASGVAIALLEKNELVYRAGSGNATGDIGRRVPAVMSVSSSQQMEREILRVEDAGSDTRIEAEICRQFGAMSLLMLPIYGDQVLAGVLQVLYDDAHHFDEREVRTYRLMIAALENGMLRQLSDTQKRDVLLAFEHAPGNRVELPRHPQLAQSSATTVAMRPDAGESSRLDSDNTAFEQPGASAWLTFRPVLSSEPNALWLAVKNTFQKAVNRPWSADFRNAGFAIGIAVALSIAVWVSQREHPSMLNPALSVTAGRDTQTQSAGQLSFANRDASNIGEAEEDASVLRPGFKRVRVGPNEVDEIAEDVTIRYFEIKHGKPRILRNAREVKFGDDVTVRYFADPDGASDGGAQQTLYQSR